MLNRAVISFSVIFAFNVCEGCFLSAKSYYELGGFHYQVTTESKAAQTWFDRGLAMCYGFNHEEAVRCFEKALAADPGMTFRTLGRDFATTKAGSLFANVA